MNWVYAHPIISGGLGGMQVLSPQPVRRMRPGRRRLWRSVAGARERPPPCTPKSPPGRTTAISTEHRVLVSD